MKIIIENGTTLIKTGDSFGGVKNKHNKTGVSIHNASDGSIKYRAEIQFKRKRFYLGLRDTPEEAAALRAEAEEQYSAGTFDEWFKKLKRTSTKTEHKIKGVSICKSPYGIQYQASIRHEGTRYYLGKSKELDKAAQWIEDAHANIEAGTFAEWYADLRNKRK